MKAGIIDPPSFAFHKRRRVNKQITSQSRSDENHKRVEQRHNGSDFHFTGFYFLAQEFGGSSHHQTADEHGYNHEGEIIHPPYPNAAKPRINLHVQHLNHA